MTEPTVNHIYWGKIDAMVAECSAMDPKSWGDMKALYTVVIDGDGQWDNEGFATKEEAKLQADYLGQMYNVPVISVSA